MKYIKYKNKKYQIDRELSVKELQEKKDTLQAHVNTIDKRTTEQVKRLKEHAKISKENAKQELDELNKL